MDYRVIQMEDLECHIVNLEENLTAKMRKNENLRVTIEKLKQGNTELTMELCDMDDKLIARDTEITELKNSMMSKDTQKSHMTRICRMKKKIQRSALLLCQMERSLRSSLRRRILPRGTLHPINVGP